MNIRRTDHMPVTTIKAPARYSVAARASSVQPVGAQPHAKAVRERPSAPILSFTQGAHAVEWAYCSEINPGRTP